MEMCDTTHGRTDLEKKESNQRSHIVSKDVCDTRVRVVWLCVCVFSHKSE